jgi:Zn-dependent membrane protease YugP
VTLVVAELPRRAAGRYDPRTRTVTIADRLIGEDPRAVAVILAHELQHALDLKRVALVLLDRDCLAR